MAQIASAIVPYPWFLPELMNMSTTSTPLSLAQLLKPKAVFWRSFAMCVTSEAIQRRLIDLPFRSRLNLDFDPKSTFVTTQTDIRKLGVDFILSIREGRDSIEFEARGATRLMASIKWAITRSEDEQHFILQPADLNIRTNLYGIRPAEMAGISFRAKDCIGFDLHPILEVAESVTVGNYSHAIDHARWQSTVVREDHGDTDLADMLLGFADEASKLQTARSKLFRRARLARLQLEVAHKAKSGVAR